MNMTGILLPKGYPTKMGQHLVAGCGFGRMKTPINILSDVSYSKLNMGTSRLNLGHLRKAVDIAQWWNSCPACMRHRNLFSRPEKEEEGGGRRLTA